MKSQNSLEKAKQSLDTVINKARIHFYKPFQIAEILRKYRFNYIDNLENVESYRISSRTWRDEVSLQLVGRKNNSSAKYQDDLFYNQNATPPSILAILGDINKKQNGIVEAYIYYKFKQKIDQIKYVRDYIYSSKPDDFYFYELINYFQSVPGLKRSIDKVYEICVYALFSTIISSLEAEVILRINNQDQNILNSFQDFLEQVLGVNLLDQESYMPEISIPADIHRVGSTNAADRGLDMWCNFGPAIQVKHVSLSEKIAKEVTSTLSSDRIVIVCNDADKKIIKLVTEQLDMGKKIQGIVTFSMLNSWYEKCLRENFSYDLGENLLHNLRSEFDMEFPSLNISHDSELFASNVIDDFITKRGYDQLTLSGIWQIDI